MVAGRDFGCRRRNRGRLIFGPQFAWPHDRPPRASRARRIYFLVFAAAFSTNLRAVRWRTIGVGLFLQIVLASVVLQSTYVQDKFKIAASGATELLNYANDGAKFVFGPLADPPSLNTPLAAERDSFSPSWCCPRSSSFPRSSRFFTTSAYSNGSCGSWPRS